MKKHTGFLSYIKEPKEVNQFTLEGELIATYTSVGAAVNAVKGTSSPGISRCCNGKLKQHKSYIWKYS